eukprot:2964766-Rhodomonas_salina.1
MLGRATVGRAKLARTTFRASFQSSVSYVRASCAGASYAGASYAGASCVGVSFDDRQATLRGELQVGSWSMITAAMDHSCSIEGENNSGSNADLDYDTRL